MDVKVVQGDVTQVKVPALIINLFEGVDQPGGATGAVDRAMDGAITELIKDGEIKGKKGENTLIHTFGKIAPSRVLVAGLGKQDSFDQETVREVMAGSLRRLRSLGFEQVATIAHGAGIAGLDARSVGEAIAEGATLGLYKFRNYLTKSSDDGRWRAKGASDSRGGRRQNQRPGEGGRAWRSHGRLRHYRQGHGK